VLALEHAESDRREVDCDLVILVHRQAFRNREHRAIEQPVMCRVDYIADHQPATHPEHRRKRGGRQEHVQHQPPSQ
jgi:hypothetical protein